MANEIEKQDSESPLMKAATLVASDGNIDVEKLSKLLEVQERWEANEARKAYAEAMSRFKENPPEILKDRHVQYQTQKGMTDYWHSTLGNVTAVINKALSEHGLTASWVTAQENGSVKVTCRITHIMGHSEQTSLSAQPDATGSKNAIQAIGSTVTYLQRYTLLALTGLATYDQDNDAAPPDTQAPMDKTMEIVDQAFFNFETQYADELAEGFAFDKDKFVKAIVKHFSKLPTNRASIKKIVDTIKLDEVMVEI